MKFVPNAVTRTVAKQVFVTQKHSPTILFVGGVVGVVATAVLTAKATLKLDEVLEDDRTERSIAADLFDRGDISESTYNKTKMKIQTQSALHVCKLYAPAIIVGAATVGALGTSQHILNKRNAALVAAYSALERSFADYRGRIVEKYGEDDERDIRHAAEKTEVEVDGKTKKVKKSTNGGSIYARFFGRDSSPDWSPDSTYNVMFIRTVQNHLNDRLAAKGHLFLNEAYDDLGLERSKEGAVVGWLWNGDGDCFVDFGVFDGHDKNAFYDFVTGREGIWLDFNVDGIIYDKI